MADVRRTVLVVDDNRLMRTMLADAMSGELAVLTAADGLEALELLDRERVDLVLTDLHMPRMDGFALIATLVQERPTLPVVAMTSLPAAVAEASLQGAAGAHVLRKPLDLPALPRYLKTLIEETTSGRVVGVSLASLLQVLHIEHKSCVMHVRDGHRTGRLFLSSGELVHAECGAARGLDAAFDIVTWERPSIEMESQGTAERTINLPIPHMLLEAMRRKDEQAHLTNPEIRSPLAMDDPGDALDAWAEWKDESTPVKDPPVGRPQSPSEPPPPRPVVAIQPLEIPPAVADALARAVRMAGAVSATLLDAQTGAPVSGPDEAQGTGLPNLLRGADLMARSAGADTADEIVVTAGEHFHVLHRLATSERLCVHLVLKRRPESLVLARNLLTRLDAELRR